MNSTYILKVVLLMLLFSACNNDKETELQNRERELKLRELKVMAIEADYKALLKMRDSLELATNIASDSVIVPKTWPLPLQRVWNSKMICTASDCINYVIGDQRNEVWRFLSDSTGLYMNVTNNDKLVRIFKGKTVDDKIVLEFNADSTANKKHHISIVLDYAQSGVIRGQQSITGDKNCVAKFSVELVPSTNK